MELWDVYDQNRKKTGRTHERGVPMKPGDYHLVVHIWIVNDLGEVLIQKRQPWKIGYPGMWDCAAAGSAIAGDDSLQAALRETKEELGLTLDASKMKCILTNQFPNHFSDVWLIKAKVNLSDLKLQYEEVADAKWVTQDEIRMMIKEGTFIPHGYMEQILSMI